jgi:hypothetical protein
MSATAHSDAHTAFDRLDHVVDGEAGHRDRSQRFHLDPGRAGHLDGRAHAQAWKRAIRLDVDHNV